MVGGLIVSFLTLLPCNSADTGGQHAERNECPVPSVSVYRAATRSTFTEVAPGIHVWTDTCNVSIIKDGSAAILIDIARAGVRRGQLCDVIVNITP